MICSFLHKSVPILRRTMSAVTKPYGDIQMCDIVRNAEKDCLRRDSTSRMKCMRESIVEK